MAQNEFNLSGMRAKMAFRIVKIADHWSSQSKGWRSYREEQEEGGGWCQDLNLIITFINILKADWVSP